MDGELTDDCGPNYICWDKIKVREKETWWTIFYPYKR